MAARPPMVQRGYETSKKVLFGLRTKADLYYSREVHQYCFLGTRGPLAPRGPNWHPPSREEQ